MAKKNNSKKAFDLKCSSIFIADPIKDIAIIGGKGVLPPEESGPLDTADGEEHPLWDLRVSKPLTDEMIVSVEVDGVLVPILIAKMGDIPVVVAGRSRVRALRRANRKLKSGELPRVIECKMKRTSDVGLMGAMHTENGVRNNDDAVTTLSKIRRALDRGTSPGDTARQFGITEAHVKALMSYEDTAIIATKKAVEDGRLSLTAASALARIKEPDKQQEALTALLASAPAAGKISRREAQVAAKGVKADLVAGVTDKKTQRKLLETIQAMPHPHASERTLAYWEGIEDAIKLVIGADDVNQKLTTLLDQVTSLIKSEKREKAKRKTKALAEAAVEAAAN